MSSRPIESLLDWKDDLTKSGSRPKLAHVNQPPLVHIAAGRHWHVQGDHTVRNLQHVGAYLALVRMVIQVIATEIMALLKLLSGKNLQKEVFQAAAALNYILKELLFLTTLHEMSQYNRVNYCKFIQHH